MSVAAQLVEVPAQTLVRVTGALDGADPWGVGGVTRDHVDAALRENRLRDNNPRWSDLFGTNDTPQMHAERIAWLVVHGWPSEETLSVEVKVSGEVLLEDGNHRLHALAYLGDNRRIAIYTYGFIDVAEELFGVPIGREVS